MGAKKKEGLELLQGTLDMLVLQILRGGELHGYGITQAIRQRSNGLLLIEAGSLYPALQRLELQKLISAKWELSSTGRRARFYKMTAAGKRKLAASTSNWDEFVAAVGLILRPVVQ